MASTTQLRTGVEPSRRVRAAPPAAKPPVQRGSDGTAVRRMRSRCACGGGCPRCQAPSGLAIGATDDAVEREADSAADRVLRMPAGAGPAEAASAPGDRIAAGLSHGIEQARGHGAPLDAGLRARFEPALGADLSRVRVHTDAGAAALARSVRARAFTTGADIFFSAGHHDPASAAGQRLLAHEVVHTLQQAQGPVDAQPAGGVLRISQPGDRHEQQAQQEADRIVAAGARGAGLPALLRVPRRPQWVHSPRAVQREPDKAAGPDSAAALLKKGPPVWSDYFEEMVPAIAEAAEANDKIGLQRALWLITQAYGEQSPGVGLPSAHRNRLFNEQAAVTFKDGKVDQVIPGQESEGVTLKKLNQNEAAKRGQTDKKVSPTFGYDTPERAVKHHIEQMAARWRPASTALTAPNSSFEKFAHALKDAHYAWAEDYDTGLISLQGQVRSQVVAWLRFTIVQRRLVRLPRLRAYADHARAAHDALAGTLGKAATALGPLGLQLQMLLDVLLLAERQLVAEQAALARLERFAAVLKVAV